MKKLLLTSACIGALSIAAIADANAWTRSGSATGPVSPHHQPAAATAPGRT